MEDKNIKKLLKAACTNLLKRILISSHTDYYHTVDAQILLNLISKNSVCNNTDETIIIDSQTSILTFPYYKKKIEDLYNDIKSNGFVEKTLTGSDCPFYIKDLNLLVMNEGASHRLAAIHKFLNDNSKEDNHIIISKKHIKFANINVELLKKLKIDKNNKKIYSINADGYKEIKKLYLNETIALIETLQLIYLEKINKLTFMDRIQYLFYKKRPLTVIERLQKSLK